MRSFPIAAIGALFLIGVGCRDACDDLADKVDACGAPLARSDVHSSCKETQAECVMACLDQNDCGRGARYANCVHACGVD